MLSTFALLAPATQAVTQAVDQPGPWELLLGRSHILALHFPLALLLVAAFLEFVSRKREQPGPNPHAFTCLWLGALSALVAAGTGWVFAEVEPLSQSQDEHLFQHRWAGVLTAVLALSATIVGALSRKRPSLRKSFRILLGVAALGVAATGHFGGEMVHGENFLFDGFTSTGSGSTSARPSSNSSASPTASSLESSATAGESTAGGAALDALATGADKDQSVSFEHDVEPIFAAHCYVCHGDAKGKGRLRLHDLEALFADGAGDWLIVPGDPDASELITRVRLPPGDLDIMPEEGDPLSPEQIDSLVRWVEQGATY